MYKQRDNEYYPPMTSDPSGSGTVSTAITAHNNSNTTNSYAGRAVAAGSRKRGRDIRGLDRFRSVVYGEDGFRRLHAMVARNPILMYPPEGIEEARARVAVRRREAQEQQQQHYRDGAVSGENPGEDDDVFALFEDRKTAEQQHQQEVRCELTGEVTSDLPTAAPQPQPTVAALCKDQELATNHHKQLDSFLRLLYEFNHVSFVKLPMEDTLQLLSRCGKEAVAHVVEYETQVRLKRQARLKELMELHQEKIALAQRRMAAEAAEEARLLTAAEQRQAELDLNGIDHADGDLNAETQDAQHSLATVVTAPQEHFTFEGKVKEEDEVKDTTLLETVTTADVRLPLVSDEGTAEQSEHEEVERVPGMSGETSRFDSHTAAA